MNATARTAGQTFAHEMRKNLGIGTRTRRHRDGRDLHTEILHSIEYAVHESGWYAPQREAIFSAASGAWRSYDAHIATRRLNGEVVAYVNSLSPWQFCSLLGEMVDAGITNVGQGERFFRTLHDRQRAAAAPAQPAVAPVAEIAPGPAPVPTAPVGQKARRARNRTRRATLKARAQATRAAAGTARRARALTASIDRRPRSLTTHALATGADTATAEGIANALRTIAKRLGIKPAQTARTRRTVKAASGRARMVRTVRRYTRAQVAVIAAAYKPRKPAYVAARLALAA